MKHCFIIGGGLAGFSSAIAALDKNFQVTLFEAEPTAFSYASSRNAAIFRTYESQPAVSLLVKQSYNLFKQWEIHSGLELLRETGLLIRPLEADYSRFPEKSPLTHEPRSLNLPDHSTLDGYFIQGNGVIQLTNYLNFLTSCLSSKVSMQLHKRVESIDSSNFVQRLTLNSGEIIAVTDNDLVIIANGSWANQSPFIKDLPFVPACTAHKRHLFLLQASANWEKMPVIWDEQQSFYLRPDPKGLLVTHGDENPVAGDDYDTDPSAKDEFRQAASECMPALIEFPIIDTRACLRTFSMDNLPICGYDPCLKNLFWQAGWGGRGVSLSPAMINYTAQLLEDPELSLNLNENVFSPGRFRS